MRSIFPELLNITVLLVTFILWKLPRRQAAHSLGLNVGNQFERDLLERGLVFAKSTSRRRLYPRCLRTRTRTSPKDAEPGRDAVERMDGVGTSDCGDQPRSRTDRLERCSLLETATDPGHRAVGRNGDRSFDSATGQPSAKDESLRRGWVWCPGSTRPAARRGCMESASAEIATSVRS